MAENLQISLEAIKEKLEEFINLEKLGLKIVYSKRDGRIIKLGITSKEILREVLGEEKEELTKDEFLKIPHISLFIEKIIIERYETQDISKERFVLSLDLPEENIKKGKINLEEIKKELALISAKLGLELKLEIIGNGILLKRFETDICEILAIIECIVLFLKLSCEGIKYIPHIF